MKLQELRVFYDTGATRELVGTLALAGQRMLFEYEARWQHNEIELAPFKMPVSRRSFQFNPAELPGNLPGLCADSLPDGWGLLIMDRFFARKGVARHDITPLDRLAYLGDHAMGALSYQPATEVDNKAEAIQVGSTAREAYQVFAGDIEEVSRLLAKVGGSPGGARPKALIGISECGQKFVSGTSTLPAGFSHWLVKFSSPVYGKLSDLGPCEGIVESVYLQMAEMAGIRVPQSRLIVDNDLSHLAVRRFDRPRHDQRLHMATACGLLHADCRLPSLDYKHLIRVAWQISSDAREVHEQYRRAIFNLLAVNRDDHSKNHSYLLGEDGTWRLSPAYDLTYSPGPNGEHWTAFLGEGKTPNKKTLLELAEIGSIGNKDALNIIARVQDAVSKFPDLCKQQGVPSGKLKPLIAEQEKARKAAV